MNRFEIEKKYETNGLKDYKLKTTDDLRNIHKINYKWVDGYEDLSEENKTIYEKFIVNIFNAFGLEGRATLVPKAIYYAQELNYLAKEDLEDDSYIVVAKTISSIDKIGFKVRKYDYDYKEYKHLDILEIERIYYFRFEYELDGDKRWLHITENGETWY
ncbi:hypothetical protein [Clostridium sp. DL1XJH146]